MNVMLTISLSLNILVLTPVVTGLIGDAGWARAAFGLRSPARGILTSVYLAILSASVARPGPLPATIPSST